MNKKMKKIFIKKKNQELHKIISYIDALLISTVFGFGVLFCNLIVLDHSVINALLWSYLLTSACMGFIYSHLVNKAKCKKEI